MVLAHQGVLGVEDGPAPRTHDLDDRGLRPGQHLDRVDPLEPEMVRADIGEHRHVHGGHAHPAQHQAAAGRLQDGESHPRLPQHHAGATGPGPVPRLDAPAGHEHPVGAAPRGEEAGLSSHPSQEPGRGRLPVRPGHGDRGDLGIEQSGRVTRIGAADGLGGCGDPLVEGNLRADPQDLHQGVADRLSGPLPLPGERHDDGPVPGRAAHGRPDEGVGRPRDRVGGLAEVHAGLGRTGEGHPDGRSGDVGVRAEEHAKLDQHGRTLPRRSRRIPLAALL